MLTNRHFVVVLQKRHGAQNDTERHVGDLGNIEAGPQGVARFNTYDTLIKLNGKNSVISRSIVVHFFPDDLGDGLFVDSKSNGHSGRKIGCGRIDKKHSKFV